MDTSRNTPQQATVLAHHDRLSDALEHAARSYAAFRPEVAAYLYHDGLERLPGCFATNDPIEESLIEAIWRLGLESIGARHFGVSSNMWRQDPRYPDTYFPRLYLDTLPILLPRVRKEDRLSLVVTLFNLGENLELAGHGLASIVGLALFEQAKWLGDNIGHRGIDSGIEDLLIQVGVLANAARHQPLGPLMRIVDVRCQEYDTRFIPGTVLLRNNVLEIRDMVRPTQLLRVTIHGKAISHVEFTSGEMTSIAPGPSGVGLELSEDGAICAGKTVVGQLSNRRCLASYVGSVESRLFAVCRRFSQAVEIYVF